MNGDIVLVTDDVSLLGTRYPDSVLHAGQLAQLTKGSAARLREPGLLGGVVDITGALDADDSGLIRAALTAGLPLVLSPGAVSALRSLAVDPVDLSLHRAWAPYLPLRRSVDVLAAADLVAAGAIGVPLHCEVTTWVGAPVIGSWDTDAPFARSVYEALMFGLDLVEQLVDQQFPATSWSRHEARGTSAVGTAVHQGAALAATQLVLPVELATAPSFSAVVTGDAGRILLRQPFAPGAVTVWDSGKRAFRSPVLRRPKANVQAPDTCLGGRETVEELESVLAGESPADLRRHTQRLTDQTIAALREPAHSTLGGEPK